MMKTSSIAFAWKISLGTVLRHVKVQSTQVMDFFQAKKVGSFLVAACFFVIFWLLNKGVRYSVDCSF